VESTNTAGGVGVGGSNPLVPTNLSDTKPKRCRGRGAQGNLVPDLLSNSD
jgi:hypothetical protein